jgi:hypothetical protein
MVDVDECTIWLVLRLSQFHRFHQDYETGHVLPAVYTPLQRYAIEFAFVTWYSAERGGMHRELDTILEAVTVQGQGWDLKFAGWTQAV